MSKPILEVAHLTQHFRINRKEAVHAVDDVSFSIRQGETLGIVGESGSGKSTIGNCVMHNVYITDG